MCIDQNDFWILFLTEDGLFGDLTPVAAVCRIICYGFTLLFRKHSVTVWSELTDQIHHGTDLAAGAGCSDDPLQDLNFSFLRSSV